VLPLHGVHAALAYLENVPAGHVKHWVELEVAKVPPYKLGLVGEVWWQETHLYTRGTCHLFPLFPLGRWDNRKVWHSFPLGTKIL